MPFLFMNLEIPLKYTSPIDWYTAMNITFLKATVAALQILPSEITMGGPAVIRQVETVT